MAEMQMPTLNDDSKVNNRRYTKTEMRDGILFFNKDPVQSKWVRWTRDFEDGYGRYQEGQVCQIEDKEKLRLYLEVGHVVPSEPAVDTVVKRDTTRYLYRFLTSTATVNSSFDENKVYELPAYIGDKYADRGMCEKVKEVPQYRAERPEKR